MHAPLAEPCAAQSREWCQIQWRGAGSRAAPLPELRVKLVELAIAPPHDPGPNLAAQLHLYKVAHTMSQQRHEKMAGKAPCRRTGPCMRLGLTASELL